MGISRRSRKVGRSNGAVGESGGGKEAEMEFVQKADKGTETEILLEEESEDDRKKRKRRIRRWTEMRKKR
jgi:ABC-type glutathione transport system ATPase component